jgi:hypothetical protein
MKLNQVNLYLMLQIASFLGHIFIQFIIWKFPKFTELVAKKFEVNGEIESNIDSLHIMYPTSSER